MDDRAKQFKIAAESQLTGSALKKEISTLRRFLFRNQEYRFTKAAQQALYMAVLAHYGNAAAHHVSGYPVATNTATAVPAPLSGASASRSFIPPEPSTSTPAASPAGASAKTAGGQSDNDDESGYDNAAGTAEAPILRLLDDALKMPFTVFTSSQKNKLLSLYWAVLGTDRPPDGNRNANGGAVDPAAFVTQRLSLMDIVQAGENKAHLSLFTDDGDEYAQEVLVDDAATLKELKKEFDEGNVVLVTVQETDTGARFLSFTVEE